VTAAGGVAHDVVAMVDGGLRRLIRVAVPEGPQHVREFPIRSPSAMVRSPLPVDVLHTEGATVDDDDERWHVKLYRCSTPEEAAALEQVLRDQAQLVRAANAAFVSAHPDDVCRWAVVQFSVAVHGEAADAATGTRYDATPEEIRSHPSAEIASWFGDGESVQPERCIVVVSEFLGPVRWHGQGGLALEEVPCFTSMARGLDVLHRKGAAHCDVKTSNVRRIDRGPVRRYVLVDGDSVIGVHSAPGPQQVRHTTLPPTVRRALGEGRRLAPEELVEIDRFGFVLLVLAALTDEDWSSQFVDHPDPEDVRAQLLSRSHGHAAVAEVFARALAPGELTAPGWSAEGWLARLREAATGLPPAVPDDQAGRGHRRDALEMRERLLAGGRSTAQDDPKQLLRAMEEQARDVQDRARAQVVHWVSVVCMVLAAIAVVWAWQAS
jgi:hypothetical protein